MQIKIGRFQAVDGSVRVTFTDGDFTHTRTVNAVLTADGSYDRAATRERVAQVAMGVQAKRGAGVFTTIAAPAEQADE